MPIFFVASGIELDLASLLQSASAAALVPIVLIALLLVRGLPALLYRPLYGDRPAVAAGLLQATSLPFIVAASHLGVQLEKLEPATAAGLVAAGLLSVLIFPAVALKLLVATVPPARSGESLG